MAKYEYYEGQLHTETYKGYDLRIENYDPNTWVCSALIPEKNTWEDILFIGGDCSLDSAIEDFREEVDTWDSYPGH